MVEGLVDDQVDLVDDDPLLDLAFVAFEADFAILHKEVDEFSGIPAVVFDGQVQRHLIVGKRDQWFQTVFDHAVKEAVIESQTFFVWFFIIAVREDSCPVDRCTQAVHAGTGQQLDIFFVGVIEIDASSLRIKQIIFLHCLLDISRIDLHVVTILRIDVILGTVDICQTPALSAFFPGTFHLVGC